MPDALTDGHAHVWVLEVDVDGAVTPAEYGVLSGDERAVANRFVRPHDRVRYVRAHALLRHLLATYMGREPARLEIERTPAGKPYLSDGPLHFNLSHSGSCVAVGLCAGGAIGVDVEAVRPGPDCRDLARTYFTDLERAWMCDGRGAEELARFYRLWTIREALVKATGAGVSALAAAVVTDEWYVETFDAVAGYAAAAVVAKGVAIEWRVRPEGCSDGDYPQLRGASGVQVQRGARVHAGLPWRPGLPGQHRRVQTRGLYGPESGTAHGA